MLKRIKGLVLISLANVMLFSGCNFMSKNDDTMEDEENAYAEEEEIMDKYDYATLITSDEAQSFIETHTEHYHTDYDVIVSTSSGDNNDYVDYDREFIYMSNSINGDFFYLDGYLYSVSSQTKMQQIYSFSEYLDHYDRYKVFYNEWFEEYDEWKLYEEGNMKIYYETSDNHFVALKYLDDKIAYVITNYQNESKAIHKAKNYMQTPSTDGYTNLTE